MGILRVVSGRVLGRLVRPGRSARSSPAGRAVFFGGHPRAGGAGKEEARPWKAEGAGARRSRRAGPTAAKIRTVEDARTSVVEYLADLHCAVRHQFGLEAVLDCWLGDVVATQPVHLEDATRQVELPAVAPFASSDTVADPQALGEWLKIKA